MKRKRIPFRLRMIWAALTLKPIAGGAEDDDAEAKKKAEEEAAAKKKADEEAAAAAAAKKPPWGDDENFDAERAWKLIEGLRDDVGKLKTAKEEAEAKVKTHEDSTKSDQEKSAERATKAEKDAAEAVAEAARLRVALDKGLTATQAKRLVGDSEEDLAKDAEDLLESFKSDDDEGKDPPRRPRERLRPGAAPSTTPDESDPAKLAEEVPRGY